MSKPVAFLWETFSRIAFTPVNKGTKSTIFAALDPTIREKPEEFKGKYIIPPGKIGKPVPQSQDLERAKELRAFSDERIKEWDIALGDV